MLLRDKLKKLDQQIKEYITYSSANFKQATEGNRSSYGFRVMADYSVPIIKYIAPQYIGTFFTNKSLFISKSEGFTWGDGVYASPLSSGQSSIMYGRCGIIGWLENIDKLNVFDANQQTGIELYQQWIQYRKHLYKRLTTTVHSQNANQLLRNEFKLHYKIDLVCFPPDEPNNSFSNPTDTWYSVSDQVNNVYSDKITNCKWCILGTEEFQKDGLGFKSLFDSVKSKTYYSGISIGNYYTAAGISKQDDFIRECVSAYDNDKLLVVMP